MGLGFGQWRRLLILTFATSPIFIRTATLFPVFPLTSWEMTIRFTLHDIKRTASDTHCPDRRPYPQFGLFAEIERDLLFSRIKMDLENTEAKGKKLGRPVGRLDMHKLDGKGSEVAELLSYRVSKSAIVRKFKVSSICFVDFVQKRGIHPIT